MKKQVKDLTNDEVDSEIQRLAKQYNITVDKDGGATATMDKLAENEARGKAEEAYETSQKKAKAETDKPKQASPAKPKQAGSVKKKPQASIAPKPKDIPKEPKQPEHSTEKPKMDKGADGFGKYLSMSSAERKAHSKKIDDEWAAKRKEAREKNRQKQEESDKAFKEKYSNPEAVARQKRVDELSKQPSKLSLLWAKKFKH